MVSYWKMGHFLSFLSLLCGAQHWLENFRERLISWQFASARVEAALVEDVLPRRGNLPCCFALKAEMQARKTPRKGFCKESET